jgi:hypothetical protein
MVIDTLGFMAKALSFGAFDGVPITTSCPFQWNQMGTTRGVPSVHTYANRAGIFDCRSCFDTGCSNSSRPPCFTGIIPPAAGLGQGSEIRGGDETAWILRPFLEKVNPRRIVRISQSGCYTPYPLEAGSDADPQCRA